MVFILITDTFELFFAVVNPSFQNQKGKFFYNGLCERSWIIVNLLSTRHKRIQWEATKRSQKIHIIEAIFSLSPGFYDKSGKPDKNKESERQRIKLGGLECLNPLINIFLILITFLLDIVLTLRGEILSWSLLRVKELKRNLLPSTNQPEHLPVTNTITHWFIFRKFLLWRFYHLNGIIHT